MPERPWTPTQWVIDPRGIAPRRLPIIAGGIGQIVDDVAVAYRLADARLILLAPSMAEAILAWDGDCSDHGNIRGYCTDDQTCPAHAAAKGRLSDLADDLREIGASK